LVQEERGVGQRFDPVVGSVWKVLFGFGRAKCGVEVKGMVM
jgi:hypothetical protein